MNNLLQRILTGVIAGTLAISAIVYSEYGLLLFCVLVSLLGLFEFFQLNKTEQTNHRSMLIVGGLIWGGYIYAHFAGQHEDAEIWIWRMLALALPIVSIVVLFNRKERNPLGSMGIKTIGILYCFLPFLLLFHLSFPNEVYEFRIPLGILILTWALDIGAYFIGRAIGKHPLFARISPKKTWEGSLGGGLLCIGFAIFFELYEFSNEGLGFNWIIIGGIIAIFSQLGDLVESMYKRSISIKDSGSILPGHGGMLDRFDGTYVSLPFIYFYLSLIG